MAGFFLLLQTACACALLISQTNAIDADTIPSNSVCAPGDTENCSIHNNNGNAKKKKKKKNGVMNEKQLEGLLAAGNMALEAKEFAKANALFERIAQEAQPNWHRMHQAQHSNGMALLQLGDGTKALWCFTNAMYLATEQTKKSQQSSSIIDALTKFTGQLSQIVMKLGQQIYLGAFAAHQKEQSDAKMLYTAAKFAHTVGKNKETKTMTQALLQLQPNHGGATLMMGLIAQSEGQEAKALRFFRKASQLEQLPHDASMAWSHLASAECAVDQFSDACSDAWLYNFEAEIKLAPMNQEIATNAVVNVCNLMLKRKFDLEEVVKLSERAVHLGLINAPLQLPKQLIPDVSFAPYRDDAATWKAVRHLEDNFQAIHDEVVEADASGVLRQMSLLDEENLHTAGEWRELNIIQRGRPFPHTLQMLPITSRIVMGLQDGNSMVHGGSKISLMQPGTVVRPHTGRTNARIRIHLGVSIPTGAYLKVGNETRTWTEGRCTVIDDSYVHEVWHTGTERRIVLIVDIWHPEMDARQRETSISEPDFLENYQKLWNDPAAGLRRQGVPQELIPSRFVSDASYVNNDNERGAGSRATTGESQEL